MSQPLNSLPPDEAGRPNLDRALAALPPHEPAAATWPRIAAQLDAEAALARAVPALPVHEPDDALWAAIAARLDAAPAAVSAPAAVASAALAPAPAAPPAVVRALWPARPVLRRALALAASVALLIGLGWWWRLAPAAGPRETLSVSEETVTEPTFYAAAPGSSALDEQGRAFIDAKCSALPGVCQSGEFRALRTQLTELEAEEQRLHQAARRFGESPALRQQQGQLTSLKAAITRELVQLLIS